MPRERCRVVYTGRVQGVGFRFTSQRLAGRFAVSGFVRNLPDGSVELLAEGDESEVRSFLEAVRGALGGKIHDTQVERETTDDPPIQGFTIRY